MPNYKKLFYQSQVNLADLKDELEKLSSKIQDAMLDAEEEIISDDEEEKIISDEDNGDID